ncbi:hypothetical protein CDL12_00159 [Handroanthus impetiginosus]|uniref:Uncharacterized protein n=1 Tax=Handroanthus impetiginosus TaxID=429701 RepID=A0A2G9IBD2_9LAMI|nr:hypothetical protein CDL12_00159 [Handroanthus impetiginosus]
MATCADVAHLGGPDINTESGSSASEPDSAKHSVPSSTMNESVNTRLEWKESEPGEPNCGDFLNGNAGQNSMSNSYNSCKNLGESAPPERQVSPEKQYRAALLRSRFADIIIKAQENTIEKGAEKLKLEREELERRRREEKARLQAEAKAAEEARKKAEVEAAAEAKKKRELEREAARQALQKGKTGFFFFSDEKTHQFMEDLEMFRSAPDEHLQSFMDEGSPENSEKGLGAFKFQPSSNPLEQLGLYMKNDDDEEEEAEAQSDPETSDNPEEGEID